MEGEQKQVDSQGNTDSKLEGFDIYPENLVTISTDKEPATELTETIPDVSTSDIYDMRHACRGHALVINQERFSYRLRYQGYGDRTGSDVDGKNIRRTLEDMGFKVTYYSDVTGAHMKKICSKMSANNHSDCDCFVCVILSHGEDGIVFGTDEAVEIKELTDYFKGDKCLTLVGKPKLFFIQACRGSATDEGVEIDMTDGEDKLPDSSVIKLPIYADFLFAYSTVPGYYSWRNQGNGSWFIQALCDNIEKYGNELEIQKLLVRVNRDVAQKFQSYNPSNKKFHRKKQVSCAVSMLTKDLYFIAK